MIISHSHKFIFVAVPKTATHSIRQALRPHLSDSDWEQVEHLKSSRFPIKEFKHIAHGHQSLSEVKPFLKEEQFKSYLKFCFVRNPYDRFISFAFFRFKDNQIFLKDPQTSMKLLLQNPNQKNDILLRPQHEFICDKNGCLEVDFIGKMESFQLDFDKIMFRLDLPKETLRVVNSTQRQKAIFYLDSELSEMIFDKFKEDFKLLGYHKNLEAFL